MTAPKIGEWMARSFTLLVLALLASCANNTELKFDDTFSPVSQTGLVVIGINLTARVGGYSLGFREFSEEKGRPFKGGCHFSMDRNPFFSDLSGRFYQIGEAEPGTYVLHNMNISRYPNPLRTCFNWGTLKFNVKQGEIIYIGDIAFSGSSFSGFSYEGHNMEAAKGYLANFGEVSGELKAVKPEMVSYQAGKSLFGYKTCPGYYPE